MPTEHPEDIVEFDPNALKELTGGKNETDKAVESQESQEIREETEKLEEQLKESDALFEELEAVPEETLKRDEVKEKLSELYGRLKMYEERFPKIANLLTVGSLGVGVMALLASVGIHMRDQALESQIYGYALEGASPGAMDALRVTFIAPLIGSAAGILTRVLGKIGEWKTNRALDSTP